MWGWLFFFEFVCFSVLLQTAHLLCCSSEVGSIESIRVLSGPCFLSKPAARVGGCRSLSAAILFQYLSLSTFRGLHLFYYCLFYFKDKALAGLYVADGESLFHLFSIGVKPRPGALPGLFETT